MSLFYLPNKRVLFVSNEMGLLGNKIEKEMVRLIKFGTCFIRQKT